MKKIVLVIAVMILTAGITLAQEYSLGKQAGPYHVTLKMKSAPAVVGDNPATIEVKDAGGEPAPVKIVSLYYFMTTMPSMHYEAKAKPDGHLYTTVITPTMPGPWRVLVKVGSGAKMNKTAFDFEAK